MEILIHIIGALIVILVSVSIIMGVVTMWHDKKSTEKYRRITIQMHIKPKINDMKNL